MLAADVDSPIFRFDEFEVNPDSKSLSRNGQLIRLRPQAFDVLVLLIKNNGRVISHREIQEAIWGAAVVTDDALVQCVTEIRRALGDQRKRVIRTVPRRGYILESPVEIIGRSESRHRRLAIAAFVFAIVGGIAFFFQSQRSNFPVLRDNSIAVLPFETNSSSYDLDYLADSLASEVMNRLSADLQLRVIAPNSAFQFDSRRDDPTTIGTDLHASYALIGEIVGDNESLRLRVRLIDTEDGSHKWSRTWERAPINLVSLPYEIASSVARILGTELPASTNVEVVLDPIMYDNYLRARHLLNLSDQQFVPEAIRLLEAVVDNEPQFVTAIVELGRANYHLWSEDRNSEHFLQAAFAAHAKALSIDPTHALANFSWGWMTLYHYGDMQTAARYFRRAFQTFPHDINVLYLATLISAAIGKPEEGVIIGKYVLDRDPLCQFCQRNLAIAYEAAGLINERIDVLQRMLREDPDWSDAHTALGRAFLSDGRAEDALQQFELASDEIWLTIAGRAVAYFYLGRHADSKVQLAQLEQETAGRPSWLVAEVYAATGDADAAFIELQEIVDTSSYIGVRFHRSPFFDLIRDDPRWPEFLEQMNLSPVQLDALGLQFLPIDQTFLVTQ